MKVLLTILAMLLAAPVLFVVGVALGPAILVVLFIGGIALFVIALVWLADAARSRHARHTRMPPLHT